MLEIKATLSNGLEPTVAEQRGKLKEVKDDVQNDPRCRVTGHVADVILSWRYQLWDTLGLSSPMTASSAGHCMRWSASSLNAPW